MQNRFFCKRKTELEKEAQGRKEKHLHQKKPEKDRGQRHQRRLTTMTLDHLLQNRKEHEKQIMISYSHKQKGTVGLIDNSLKKRLKDTHTIWIDKRNMYGRMSKTLDKAIFNSSIVLLCTSKAYEESKYCKFECDKVLEHDKKLIPLKMESYKPKENSLIQQLIAGRLYIDFSNTILYDDNINTLIRNIEELENEQM